MNLDIKSHHLLWRLFLIIALISGACKFLFPEVAMPTSAPTQGVVQTPGQTPGQTPLEPTSPPPPSTATSTPSIPLSPLPRFAVYNEQAADIRPSIQHEAVASDLRNVYNPFVLSKSQLQILTANGFVVSPGKEKEFFTLYEKARYDNLPVFVTSDSLLHVYHLLFDKVLRTAETQYFIPMLRELNQALLAQTDSQYQALSSTPWEDAAKRTVAFVAVASELLDPGVKIPGYAKDLAKAELALIDAAAGFQPSPIFPGLKYGEDYTQYIPRGHYTKSEELKKYFRSMMWYGRMTFRLTTEEPEVGRAETRSALLLVYALRNAQVRGAPATKAWEELYSPTVFFVGRSDDLNVVQYGDVINAVYGLTPDLMSLTDEAKLDQFISLANTLPPPRILGIVIDITQEEEKTTKGLRFMGQRFVPDAYIFRQLIFRNVGTLEHRRGLPKGLDLMAAMGSERAYQILESLGETSYENYPQQMNKMKSWLAGLSVDEWTETLYNSWLYTFYPLLDVPGEGYPGFMRSQAWLDKQLNTSLGSWAELKHDTILYAKQVYAELGGGPPPPPPVPPKGYVEPVPQFYARLKALTVMTRTGLEQRGLVNELDRNSLLKLEELVSEFQTMAEKELRAEPLTDSEYERIRFYGGDLENLTMAAADSDASDPFAKKFMEEEPQAAVIADVATDPQPSDAPGPVVLQEAVGRINEMHVIVPIKQTDGSITLQVAKGGVFSYYEFSWPANDRLTDEKWRQMLDNGTAPPLPQWINTFFTSEGEYSEIGRAVHNFQESLTFAYWQPEGVYWEGEGVALQPFRPEIEGYKFAKQYVSHQLVSSQIRSFDLQSDTQAVVTVREVWQDKLYQYTGDYPQYTEQPIKERGPYTLDVTYTLQLIQGNVGGGWQVVLVVYASPPPAW